MSNTEKIRFSYPDGSEGLVEHDTALDPKARAVAVHELVVACEAASVMGVKNLVLHPGPERSGRPPEAEFLEQIARGATILAALEAAVGLDPACDPTLLIATAFRTGIFREISS